MLVEVSVFVDVSLLYKLQDVVVADIDVQVLIKHALNLIDTNLTSFFSVEEGEHVQSFFFSASAKKPFFGYEINHFTQRETILVLIGAGDFILDLLSIHFGVCEVAENASEILTIDVSCVAWVIERKGILDFVLLDKRWGTMSSESLLLRLEFLPPLVFATFFLAPFISYKIIVQNTHSIDI